MVSFQVPVASEIINLLNFVWSDIILIAAVMFLSSRAAGLINSKRVRRDAEMNLKPFDIPHIGGGMVMNYGWKRSLIALLRLSAILSVCIGNFGLQGRSETSFKTNLTDVRVPGSLEDFKAELLFNITEIRMRCAQLEGDQLFFGSVIDNKCYLDLHEHVYVRSLSMGIGNVTTAVKYNDCTTRVFRDRFYTVLKCGGMDLSCSGPHLDSPIMDERTCHSVVYEGNTSWLCLPKFNPYSGENQTVACRKVGAQKKDIEHWTDLFRVMTLDPLQSIFGAAYGQRRMLEADIPGDEKSVTIVTLWWIIPAIWQVILVTGLLVCFFSLRGRGTKAYGNDERSLLTMLREASARINDLTDESEGHNVV